LARAPTHIGVKEEMLMRAFVGSFQSLEKLLFGQIDSINSIDGAASFTLSTLSSAISQILAARAPDNIRTQDYLRAYDGSDHSDHLTAARITQQVAGTTPLTGYMGYPIQVGSIQYKASLLASAIATLTSYLQDLPPTFSTTSAEYQGKTSAFFAYTPFDFVRSPVPSARRTSHVARRIITDFAPRQLECQSISGCGARPESSWLQREYDVFGNPTE
jgi:LmbE family N-acetylglucosaminyl deacetylase